MWYAAARHVLKMPAGHIFSKLLTLISKLWSKPLRGLLLILAVVAGLGADINIVAGQVGAQTHILTLVAEGKA